MLPCVGLSSQVNFPGLGLESFVESNGQKVFFLDNELMPAACIASASHVLHAINDICVCTHVS